jgi:hypothetical protein
MQSSGLDPVAAAARVIEIAEQFPAYFVFRHTIKSSMVPTANEIRMEQLRSPPRIECLRFVR